jgi:hypothetical protein
MRMKPLGLAAVVVAAGCLLYSGDLFASASGGGHGSGGHSSGGHASNGGRGASGHGSRGHASSGGTHSGSHATAAPRGSSSSGTTPSTASGTATSTPTSGASGRHQQNGQPTIGVAVPRLTPSASTPVPGLLPSRVIWPYYGPAYGFGAFSSLYGSRYSMFGFGYGRYGYGGYDTFGGWPFSGYGGTYPFDAFEESGSLRLEVEPKDAEVFVDGYYAGIVDEFDGHFQKLDLIPGPHRVEIRRPGYDPLVFDIVTQAHHKETYRGKLSPSEL